MIAVRGKKIQMHVFFADRNQPLQGGNLAKMVTKISKKTVCIASCDDGKSVHVLC